MEHLGEPRGTGRLGLLEDVEQEPEETPAVKVVKRGFKPANEE